MADQPLVFICSPYAGDVETNITYARDALLHSLRRGEAPIAPHLLYPQALRAGDDRRLGMVAGKTILARCSLLAVYVDLGESSGMRSEVSFAMRQGIPIERRRIGSPEHEILDATPPDGTNVVNVDDL